MELLDMIQKYERLLSVKTDLEDQVQENKDAIEAVKQEIIQQMLDDDTPKITTGGYAYSLTAKTSYSKRGDADLLEAGVDFFDVLRDEGLGDIIKETVNSRTLQSTMKAYVEEHGELSEDLGKVIRTYDFNDVTRRKESKRGGKSK